MVTWVEVTWMEALLNQLPVLFQCASSGVGAEGVPDRVPTVVGSQFPVESCRVVLACPGPQQASGDQH